MSFRNNNNNPNSPSSFYEDNPFPFEVENDEIRQLYEEEWKQQNVHQEPINIQPMNSSNNISPSLQSSSFLENWNRNMTPSKNMTPSNPGTYLPFPFRLQTQPLNDSSKQTFQPLQPLLDIENNFSLQEEETNHDAFQKTHPTLFDIWKNIRIGMSEAELAKKLKVTSSPYQVTPSYYLGKYTYQDPKGHTKHATYEDLKKIESQENLVKLFPETWNAISLNMGEKIGGKNLSQMVNNQFKTFAQTETKHFHFGEIYDACKKSKTFTAANEYLGKSRGELSKFFKSLYYISSDGEGIFLNNKILYRALHQLKSDEAGLRFRKIYDKAIENPVRDEIRQLYEEEVKKQNVPQESINTQPINENNENILYQSLLDIDNFSLPEETSNLMLQAETTRLMLEPETSLKIDAFKKTNPTLLDIWKNIYIDKMREAELALKLKVSPSHYLGKYTYEDPKGHTKHATYDYLKEIKSEEALIKLFPETWNAISFRKGDGSLSKREVQNHFKTFNPKIKDFNFGEIHDACQKKFFCDADNYLGQSASAGTLAKFFKKLYYISSDGRRINLNRTILYSALNRLKPDEARERFIEIYDKPIENPVCDEIRQLYEKEVKQQYAYQEEFKQQGLHQEPINTQPVNIQPKNSSNNTSLSPLQSFSFLQKLGSAPSNSDKLRLIQNPFKRAQTQDNSSQQTFQDTPAFSSSNENEQIESPLKKQKIQQTDKPEIIYFSTTSKITTTTKK